jgi:uncharacterized protein (TIGR03067 family)
MCPTVLLISAAVSLGFAPAPFPRTASDSDANKAELRRLQGVWEVVRYQREKLVLKDAGLRLTFAGSRMTWAYDGNVCTQWAVTVLACASPKTFGQQAVPAGSRLPQESIYRLKGDALEICSPLDGLHGRPTSMEPRRGYVLYHLRRVSR